MTAPMLELESGESRTDPHLASFGAMVVAVAIVLMFAGLLAAWYSLRSGTLVWPPKGIALQDYYGNTLSITMLIAAVVAEWAARSVRREERAQAIGAFVLQLFVGLAFLNLLSYVVATAHFGPATHPFGVMFFAFAALVTVAVVVAMVATIVALARFLGRQVDQGEPAIARAAALLWYAAIAGWFIVYFAEYQFR